MSNSDVTTVPVKKCRRKCKKCKRNKTLPKVESKIPRINCFGEIELLDRDSVAEAIETEERYNRELEEFLKGVKGK